MDLLSEQLLDNMRSISETIDLPYLGGAARQWGETLQGISAELLGSERLLRSTFSALSGILSGLSVTDPGLVVEEWQHLVEEEAERHDGRELPSWLQGFFVNLLFFLLSLIYSTRSAKENAARLDVLESGQAAIVEAVEGKAEEVQDNQEDQELELAAIRQALENLAEAVSESESPPSLNLRIAMASVRLRSEPSTDSDVLLGIPKGFPVEIVEELEDWCRIQVMDFASGELAEGWVAKEYLREWDEVDD